MNIRMPHAALPARRTLRLSEHGFIAAVILRLLFALAVNYRRDSAAYPVQNAEQRGEKQPAAGILSVTCYQHEYQNETDSRAEIVQQQCEPERQTGQSEQQTEQRNDKRENKNRYQRNKRRCIACKEGCRRSQHKRYDGIHYACHAYDSAEHRCRAALTGALPLCRIFAVFHAFSPIESC